MDSPAIASPSPEQRRDQAGGGPTAAALTAQWRIADLDLAAYLGRLGCSDLLAPLPSDRPAGADLPTLRRLHRAHVGAIAFGNVDVVLGRPPSLDLPRIQDKLVGRRRGGYCFEQNLLFAAALERLGFTVTRLGARVQMGTDDLRPLTHMTLLVDAGAGADGPEPGGPWLADVGFGGEGLLEPVPLVSGTVVEQDGWEFQLRQLDRSGTPAWMLGAIHHDGLFDLYSFTLDPLLLVDYVVANHYVATHANSPFVRQLVIQRTGARRHTLIGSALVTTTPDGGADYVEVAPAELPDTLLDVFGIDVADDADLLVATASEGP